MPTVILAREAHSGRSKYYKSQLEGLRYGCHEHSH